MDLSEILFILLGVFLGGLAGWSLGSARARVSLAKHVAEIEGRASAAEALRDELGRQIERCHQETAEIRLSLESERRARTEAQARLEAAQQNLQEQKRLLEDATVKLTDTFKALSGEALKSNNQSFLELAKSSLEAVTVEAKGDLSKRQEAVDGLIKPLQETLNRYEEQIRAMEEKRQAAYGGLEEQVKALSSAHAQLQKETGNLVMALRTPQVRGRWGEVTLHRVVELAGMSDHCDYAEQTTIGSEGGPLRPDMIVHLPADREIVVDAKVSLDAYLDALSASSEEERKAALARHAQQLRTHMNKLAAKSYWEYLPKAPEFVVMFIPGESFFAAAVDCDHSLIEDGMAKQVVLATPTTLIALLRAVAYGWQQAKVAENAQVISELGKQLYERLRTFVEHIESMGNSLRKALDAHDRAVGSLESRVLPAARRFKELGATAGDEIVALEPINRAPRSLRIAEVTESDES
jgi:DNA recombination protein RmuC